MRYRESESMIPRELLNELPNTHGYYGEIRTVGGSRYIRVDSVEKWLALKDEPPKEVPPGCIGETNVAVGGVISPGGWRIRAVIFAPKIEHPELLVPYDIQIAGKNAVVGKKFNFSAGRQWMRVQGEWAERFCYYGENELLLDNTAQVTVTITTPCPTSMALGLVAERVA